MPLLLLIGFILLVPLFSGAIWLAARFAPPLRRRLEGHSIVGEVISGLFISPFIALAAALLGAVVYLTAGF